MVTHSVDDNRFVPLGSIRGKEDNKLIKSFNSYILHLLNQHEKDVAIIAVENGVLEDLQCSQGHKQPDEIVV